MPNKHGEHLMDLSFYIRLIIKDLLELLGLVTLQTFPCVQCQKVEDIIVIELFKIIFYHNGPFCLH